MVGVPAGEVWTARQRRPRVTTAPVPCQGIRLSLLRGFQLVCRGRPVDLPLSAQRPLAFLALQRRPVLRTYVAGSLWPDVPEGRAQANLRSALWRVGRSGCRLAEARCNGLQLAAEVALDYADAVTAAEEMIGSTTADLAQVADLCQAGDLLPDWCDDWIAVERERFRALRLLALEKACEALTAAGQLAVAVEAGLAVVAEDPLRESAHRALIRAFLARGNRAEAVRQVRSCRAVLREALDLEPSPEIEELVAGLVGAPQTVLIPT